MSHINKKRLPSTRMNDFSFVSVVDYLQQIQGGNVGAGFGVNQFLCGNTVSGTGYLGGVYSPTQNRIYLCPYSQSNVAIWHYINCDTGAVVAYTHGFGTTIITGAYYGGVYSPTQNRIYFTPYSINLAAQWHYLDCNTGMVVAYTHGFGTSTPGLAYISGAYSPIQNRIYFAPYGISATAQWHYVDCNTGAIVAYTHGTGIAMASSYYSGVYSPTQDRVYFMPFAQSTSANWHYVDCATGAIVAYTHGATAAANAYAGGAYSPNQNRIYLAPRGQAPSAQWHYIDCNTGAVVAYTHGATAVANAYAGAVYSPTQNRIFFVPINQSDSGVWHYLDCNTGAVVAYARKVTVLVSAYVGGVYSPTQNRIYLMPYQQSNQTYWHYIQEFSNSKVSPSLMASAMFNKL